MSSTLPSLPVTSSTEDAHHTRTVLKQSAFFGWKEWIGRIYAADRREKIQAATRLYSHVVGAENIDDHSAELSELEVVFSTWGMPVLTQRQLDAMPQLRAVFYAGGSVRAFAHPLLERGITVVSAWHANAVPVAEFTLAQILLAMKGYFRNTREYKSPASVSTAFRGRGCFGEGVAILGAGAIGSCLIELLRSFDLRVFVFDPFLSWNDAQTMGVEKVTLEEAFERAYVVSNHLADVPETIGLLNGSFFERMQPDATFINTGRGATVDEAALILALQRRPDLMALLDVTRDEPPAEGSPLYTLPNVQLSAHIAGSINSELGRMGDYCFEEFLSWNHGMPLRFAVSMAMLKTMA